VPPLPGPSVPVAILAFGATVVFLCGVLSYVAVQGAKTVESVKEIMAGMGRAGIPIRGAPAQHVTGGPIVPNATGGGRVGVSSLPVPAWSQTGDITVVNRPAWTGATDCGPEAVAAVVRSYTGVETVAELLRLRVFGVIDPRLTSGADLVRMFSHNHIQAAADGPAWPQLRAILDNEISRGALVIVLKRYSTNLNAPHWVTVDGLVDGISYMDTIGGVYRRVSESEFATLYRGECVTSVGKATYNK
jgi:hypothetical protein